VHLVKPAELNSSDQPSPLRDITSPSALRPAIHEVFALTGADSRFGERTLDLAERLFGGEIWKAQPITLRYHDFAHTLQASYCLLDLIAGHARGNPSPFSPREVELGLAAVLLHDSGYLKVAGDNDGTGAKYTYSHVLRSCGLAASLLPTLGCSLEEVDLVVGVIRCTGVSGNPALINFRSSNAHLIGCMVATADYLGQMAAPEYPDKLPYLFQEFAEADVFNNIPPEKRAFSTAEAMIAATPGFWVNFVRPKLDTDFQGVHRFLAPPGQPDTNPYFAAVETNIAIIRARSASTTPALANPVA